MGFCYYLTGLLTKIHGLKSMENFVKLYYPNPLMTKILVVNDVLQSGLICF